MFNTKNKNKNKKNQQQPNKPEKPEKYKKITSENSLTDSVTNICERLASYPVELFT